MGPVGESGRLGARPGGRLAKPAHTSVPTAALTAAGWVAGFTVTALIIGTPYLVYGVHSPALHLVLGTVDACVALLVAYLVYGRFRRSHRLQDLLLSEGLFLLAIAGLGLVLLLHLFEARPGTVDVWLPLALRTVAAALIAVASVSDRRAPSIGHGWGRSAPWLLLLAAFGVFWLLRSHLPLALSAVPPSSAQRPVIDGHPVLLGAQAFAALCFMVASIAFTVRAVRRHDELLRWLGPACALSAFARLNYVLFPSLYSDWLYTGDLLRTASYVLLLVGAAREISQYWSDRARTAVLDDRRRLAREIHDGLVQELVYIRAEARSLPGAGERTGTIVAACDRALDEARAAVDALGRSGEESLASLLHSAAGQVAERYDARLDVEVDHTVSADPEQRHALVRIAREAVSNAIRHGGATCVRVRLCREAGRHRLLVEDDGRGFDVAAVARGNGFGLTSMRERARALPGDLEIRTAPGEGTSVGVTW